MKRRLISLILSVFMVITLAPGMAFAEGEQTDTNAPRQMEYLKRGGYAADISAYGTGVYLSWRLLGTEPMDTSFNIYKNGAVLVEALANTNYTDESGTAADVYTVAPVIGGTEGAQSEPFMKLTGYRDKNYKNSPYAYFDVPINRPEGGNGYNYNPENTKDNPGGANDASVGDVDGDGEYEIILKWDPSNSKDSAAGGATGLVYLDCYEFDGTQLWRINLGRNIRAGAHYTQFQVYDYDGDGKAEVAVKTAPGSIDGKGRYVSEAGNTETIRTTDNSKSYLGNNGHVAGGPEYLTIFCGETGEAMQTIDYDPPVGNVGDWGDEKYNRSDRFLAGTAYLDGVHPSMLFCRGYYGKSVIVAYDWDGTNLTKRWKLDSTSSSSNDFYGQGNHQLSVADLDGDGKDEIIYGGAAVDEKDGKGVVLWSAKTGGRKLGHGDALHVSDFDNDGEQEIYKVNEDSPTWGETFIDNNGNILWHITSQTPDSKGKYDDGRGVIGNFSPKYGVLAWDARNGICTIDKEGAESGKGGNISKKTSQDNNWSAANFRIYWDGDLYDEHFDGNRISKWSDYDEPDADGNLGGFGRLWDIPGISYNNTSKKNPCLQADLFGDWREELILRTTDNNALRVFTSLSPTDYKFTTFMHDSQYRCAIAWQNTAYNQPPHQSYYIGYDKAISEYKQPNIKVRELDPEAVIAVTTKDGTPAVGVNVKLGGIEKPTGSDGKVSFRVPAGKYSVVVDQVGYIAASDTIEFAEGDSFAEKQIVIEELPNSSITVMSGGAPVSGAEVVIGGQTVKTDDKGGAVVKLRAGEYDYTASCHKYVTKTDKLTVPESNTVEAVIELEAINYVYDSDKDTDGSQFAYSGGAGAELTFDGGAWTLTQNSTDGGKGFEAVFDSSADGNVEFEMVYKNGAQKDSGGNWNWKGREYTHVIELRDIYGSVVAGLSQEYKETGVQELKYYTDAVGKTNVSSGTLLGGGSITSRSSITWKIKYNINLKDKTVDITVTDEAEQNGYQLSKIKMNSTTFSSLYIGTASSGNVTCAPSVSKVLYQSDCIDKTVVPVPPTPTPTPTPMEYKTWTFDEEQVGKTYAGGDKIANQNGDELAISYGTANTAPIAAERDGGGNYIKFDDKGAGTDGWTYSGAIDSDKITFETDFMMGDTNKDTILLRILDSVNAGTNSTYTDKADGRAFEIKTGDKGVLKLSDYFSKGSSDTKPLDKDISGFTFEANKWYSVKIEYTRDNDTVKVYTKADGGSYSARLTYVLGSGTNKGSVPKLTPTGLTCSTRGSSPNELGVDNISIGYYAKQDDFDAAYVINSVTYSAGTATVNITKNTDNAAEVIVAAYNADGVVTAAATQNIDAANGETKDITVEINASSGDKIVAYVWGDTGLIIPLAIPKPYSAN